jgi:16S rRNA (adenine1518-N6/adenine1519-N6)-dimethyltransferase
MKTRSTRPPARKRFGQHFLEPAWVRKVIAAIDPKPDERFIEIGPGRGALTRPLAERVSHVTAYEIDRDLARELHDAALPNITIIEGDFLDAAPPALCPLPSALHDVSPVPSALNEVSAVPSALRVAANLPYNVASPILFQLIDWSRRGVPIADATIMLQREVADRLLAKPGTRDYGVLTVLIRHRATIERLLSLPPGAFRPPPKVHSAVVRLRFHPPDPPVDDEDAFERLVKQAFSQRRKTLANALRGLTPNLAEGQTAHIDRRRRPETLSVAEYAKLAGLLRNNA